MSWGQAAEGGSKLGEGTQAANTYGDMASAGGGAESGASAGGAQPFSGFEVTPKATQGPTTGAADMQTYGTSDPSFMQRAGNSLERFQRGGNQGLNDTYKNFGNNPETYGAIYGMANKMAGSGKPASAAPITTNISYQQPAAQKRGRYW